MRTQFSDFPIFSQLMECGLKYTRSECEMGKRKGERNEKRNEKKIIKKENVLLSFSIKQRIRFDIRSL